MPHGGPPHAPASIVGGARPGEAGRVRAEEIKGSLGGGFFSCSAVRWAGLIPSGFNQLVIKLLKVPLLPNMTTTSHRITLLGRPCVMPPASHAPPPLEAAVSL